MEQDLIPVVIVGHVDHGKSTFIGRFLYDTENLSPDKLEDIKKTSEELGQKVEFAHIMDQFREEREKNITIDTSQTFFSLGDQSYVFVDAPGHKEYLKNMITGATQAENAILLLDVKEGIREQTEKHIQILKLLGISSLAVLINKMDLVSFDQNEFEQIKETVEDVLSKHKMKANYIIPISAYEGDNITKSSEKMAWYKGPHVKSFVENLNKNSENRFQDQPVCFPVQLVHKIKNDSYVLGRVEKGTISVDQTLLVFPVKSKIKIKKILKFKEKQKQAYPGESVALVLDDDSSVRRGSVLCSGQNQMNPAESFESHSFWAASMPLRPKDEVLIECRTQSVVCQVESITDELGKMNLPNLSPGDIGFVEFKPKLPLFIQASDVKDPFSRIVFHKNGDIAGCGVVAATRLNN